MGEGSSKGFTAGFLTGLVAIATLYYLARPRIIEQARANVRALPSTLPPDLGPAVEFLRAPAAAHALADCVADALNKELPL